MNKKIDIPIHIDLNKIKSIMLTAINEAGVYAGFTYNVRKDINFINYELVEDSSIQFIPLTTKADTIKEYKEYFYNWVIMNTFKYVIDRFSIFLDEIYYVCALYRLHKTTYSNELFENLNKQKKNFHGKNFLEKLDYLRAEFNIVPYKYMALASIQSARNCLTHRNGIVGKTDLKCNPELKIEWTGFHIFAKDSSGKEHDLNFIPPEGVKFPQGTAIFTIKPHADKQKVFQLNEKIIFTAKEFCEILLYMLKETDCFIKAAEEFAKLQGISILK